MLNFNDIHQKTVINCELLTAAEIEGALQSFAAVRKVDLITTAILLARSQNTLGKKRLACLGGECIRTYPQRMLSPCQSRSSDDCLLR